LKTPNAPFQTNLQFTGEPTNFIPPSAPCGIFLNYNLEKCHKSDPLFQAVKPITLFSSLKSFTFRLWDEKHKQLVGYHRLRQLRKQQNQSPRPKN